MNRKQTVFDIRVCAAKVAKDRVHPAHQANGDEQRYKDARYFMSFTKGLPHNPKTGLLEDPADFVAFRKAIDDGYVEAFTTKVKHGGKYKVELVGDSYQVLPDGAANNSFRRWEAPTAGFVTDLQGPDAQAVTMPPAPPLKNECGRVNAELVFEMAEVYELALLRDQPLNAFEGTGSTAVNNSVKRLNALDYIKNRSFGRPRKLNGVGKLDAQTVFRGSSVGVEKGPYLSQLLLIGNTNIAGHGQTATGHIGYGVLSVDQRVPVAEPSRDYMVDMDTYVSVQRGWAQPLEQYVTDPATSNSNIVTRFISTPRDLATYVHYDALYEAYLNACFVLLRMGTPFDPTFDVLSGSRGTNDVSTRLHSTGFALYGGPHILTLLTEVATRCLKAVRYQKFNNHIRLRPEALAGKIELVRRAAQDNNIEVGCDVPTALYEDIGCLSAPLEQTLCAIAELNQKSDVGESNYFLPMAFPEGSPMHPSYGAGHAAVAGGCVTILKAFFDTDAVLAQTSTGEVVFKKQEAGDEPVEFRVPDITVPSTVSSVLSEMAGAMSLKASKPSEFLTLEGELNKLAANIAIGRNMAGVHFFSDYYDSLRMGEEIALGMLEEQALTYLKDPFEMTMYKFDSSSEPIKIKKPNI